LGADSQELSIRVIFAPQGIRVWCSREIGREQRREFFIRVPCSAIRRGGDILVQLAALLPTGMKVWETSWRENYVFNRGLGLIQVLVVYFIVPEGHPRSYARRTRHWTLSGGLLEVWDLELG